MIETLEWLVESCERTAEAPDLLSDDRLAEPEPAVAAKLLLDAVSQERPLARITDLPDTSDLIPRLRGRRRESCGWRLLTDVL